MKDSRSLTEATEVGSRVYEKNLVEEMRELGKLRTAVMVEKCLSKNEGVMCPKPRRRHMRHFGEHTDIKVGGELSDIIINKASPPCYSVSPPVRASNPLIQDARFREQRISQSSTPGVRLEGFGNVGHSRRSQSIPTVA
ncbi:uncharacterized protein LOC122081361 [Macadamia integrifolia]|uniref:uncharacterized protein LOC122081361 n=1 Tax=Macadamia integrifolia TaxID=60698 RepID=UPI001C4F248C|nr:uncharacterized protein LOC122081361 [Macadamia integrifolia]XP_042504388.1 uncharacterized protein LOC122081361 [Macadamia integrifolia]